MNLQQNIVVVTELSEFFFMTQQSKSECYISYILLVTYSKNDIFFYQGTLKLENSSKYSFRIFD